MLRIKAVRSLLLDLAGLREVEDAGPEADDDRTLSERDEDRAVAQRDELDRARKKAVGAVLIDTAAIVALFLVRDRSREFLPTGRDIGTVFTIGILVVAVHLGFRLAHAMWLRSVERVWDELPD